MTATALLLRTAGMVFRVYISNKLGAEGMGLYQLLVSLYVLAATFASSGLTVAVTCLASDEAGRGRAGAAVPILKKSLLPAIAVGAATCAALFLAADWVSLHWIGDSRAADALRVLAPSLPFIAISSCLRGYFIARRGIARSAGAQVLEQFVRILVVMLLLDAALARGIRFATAAVMIGTTVSEAVSCLYMYMGFVRDKRALSGATTAPKRFWRQLFGIAVPLALGSYLRSALRTIENLIVPDCLTRFTLSRETSLAQFGMLKGMAMPALFFPSAFLSALSTLLVPEISEAHAAGQTQRMQRTISRSLRLTMLLSMLLSGVFVLYSRQLGQLLYGSAEVGLYMLVLAPAMPLMYMESIAAGILNGLKQQTTSLKYSGIDSCLRIALIFALVPAWGINGFLFIMLVSNLMTSVLNMRRLLEVTGLRFDWKRWFLLPLVAMLPAGAASLALCGALQVAGAGPLYGVLAGIAAAAALYLALSMMMGCIRKSDLRFVLPGGRATR